MIKFKHDVNRLQTISVFTAWYYTLQIRWGRVYDKKTIADDCFKWVISSLHITKSTCSARFSMFLFRFDAACTSSTCVSSRGIVYKLPWFLNQSEKCTSAWATSIKNDLFSATSIGPLMNYVCISSYVGRNGYWY